ncbi:hypothetical protein IKE_05992 [Bacillus cereus VD196]|uniref:Transposase putative helix-turn-helix domain-containing protein n=1 Tax=Bacillus cereus VD196 TaxID=1053243 RepID=A0A9W5PY85_BACCE|nr:hypothetical protein IKG_05987 [Bacillus cereus VD200]EOO60141.1 hypothetical protein IKE_05992 [Bacillus cereus VD196]
MTKHNKAYKFRLYPTEQQAYLMRKTFGCVRFVDNKMLAERKEAYENTKMIRNNARNKSFQLSRNTKQNLSG